MPNVRLTFIHDSFNRTAVAALIAALEDVVEDPATSIRTARSSEVADLDLDETGGKREIVCFSIMTAHAAKAVRIHTNLRRRWGDAFTSIAGGAGATGDPGNLLEAGFDYCCVGEGEQVIREVQRRAEAGEPLDAVPGLFRLERGDIRGEPAGGPVEIEHFSGLPLEVQFPTYIEIGRGCRWKCLYCQTPQIHGNKERYRSPEKVAEIVRRYAEFGMKDFRFLLPNALGYMSGQPGIPDVAALEDLLGRSKRVCSGGRLFLGSFPSEVRPDYVTEPALRVLKAYVSNNGLVIGGQSGSEGVLGAVKRGHGVETIRRACDISLACGFEPSVDLVLGFPGETAKDRAATLDFVEYLGTLGAVINMHFFMPLPGTALASARPVFLSEGLRRRLDRYAQQGILRGRWRRQESVSRKWVDR